MTSIEWLLSELEKVNYHPTDAMIMYANRLHNREMREMYLKGIENYDPTFVRKPSDKAEDATCEYSGLPSVESYTEAEYPELEGTKNLCKDITKKRTGKMTEEEWQAAERWSPADEWEGCDGCTETDKYFWTKGYQAGYNRAKPVEISDTEINNYAVRYRLTNGQISFRDGARWHRDESKKRGGDGYAEYIIP